MSGDEATLRTVIVSETAPAPTSPEQFWLAPVDVSDMGFSGGRQPSYQLYVRNPDDDRWLLASAGATRVDLANDSDPRTVGSFDGDNAEWIGLRALETTREVWLSTVSIDGGTLCRVQLNDSELVVKWSGAELRSIILDDTGIKVSGIPTVDPAIAGALWNSSGTLKISAG